MIYTNSNQYYKMLRPVGSCSRRDYEQYALWMPVKRFLGVFWIRNGQNFWLDIDGFIPLRKLPEEVNK